VENQDACPLKYEQTSHILDYQAAVVKLRGSPAYTKPGRCQPTSCLAAAATHVVISCGTAASCRRQAVGDKRPPCSCLFMTFQAASKYCPWEVLHCFEQKACWPTCVNGASRQPTVAKTDVHCRWCWNWENGGRWHSREHNTSALALPGSCRRDVQ